MTVETRYIQSPISEVRTFTAAELGQFDSPETANLEQLISLTEEIVGSCLPDNLSPLETDRAIQFVRRGFSEALHFSRSSRCSPFVVAQTIRLLAIHRFFMPNIVFQQICYVSSDYQLAKLICINIKKNTKNKKIGSISIKYERNNDITFTYTYPKVIAPIHAPVRFRNL